MSEGPEVRLTADKICKGICGKTIDKVYCKPTISNELSSKIIGSHVTYMYRYSVLAINRIKSLLMMELMLSSQFSSFNKCEVSSFFI